MNRSEAESKFFDAADEYFWLIWQKAEIIDKSMKDKNHFETLRFYFVFNVISMEIYKN